MSEYQYYEFLALDRSLAEKEMVELRSKSTRAQITPTSFTNAYHWGSFKGNAEIWMEKYFDAHLHLADWGYRVLSFRLPSEILDLPTAREYHRKKFAHAYEKNGRIILSLVSNRELEDGWEDEDEESGEGCLARIVPVRTALHAGDLRGLYLGWLLGVQSEEFGDDDLEPPIPPGLREMTPSLDAMAAFLRIDRDLLAAAADASPPIGAVASHRAKMLEWIAALPVKEKDDCLARLMTGSDPAIGTGLLRRFLKEREETTPNGKLPRRTVGALLQEAAVRRAERQRQADEEKRRIEEKVAHARAAHLDRIAGRKDELWREIERLIAVKRRANYDQATQHLLDLRDLSRREDGAVEFEAKLAAFRAKHWRKRRFMLQLSNAGV
jgi:hypothetical protein